MKMTITRLELTNFKCFRHKVLTFDSDITTIRGRNGVGKTTIADAILFCLFGKNTAGQSDLELFKTREDGKVIPNIDHSVEMDLAVVYADSPADRVVTLRRSIKELWVKKRGSEETVFKNNTCEYFVNGESYTQADFKKYIDTLISEDIFRAITNPAHFLSLKWQVQREFLAKMVGDINAEDIIKEYGDDNLMYALRKNLETNNEDIIAYRKHLSYQIKQIKDKLDKIPVRLEEQNKALPEKLDWDALEAQRTDVSRQQQEIAEKIIAIKSGNGGDVLRDEIRKEIYAIRTDMEKIEAEQRKHLRLRQDEQDRAIQTARQQFNTLVTTQRDLEASLPSFDKLIERCRETLDQCEKDAQEIREDWALNLRRTLNFTDSDCVCPTCGQYLQQEQVMEKRQKAEDNLNADKARIKTELTNRAERVKNLRAKAEDETKNYEAQKAEAEKNLADTKVQINVAFSHKQKLEKVVIPTLGEILKGNPQYLALSAKLKEQQAKLDSVALTQDDNTQLADLEAQKVQYTATLSQLSSQLATKSQYDRIQQLIDGINSEQKDLVKQLSDLEKKEDIACQYQDRQNAILEERVNQHFSLVRWRMFRTINNSGDSFQEPYCECLVDGIPYGGGLNQASRLNAGLDVINTLCRHYNVTAPIVIDNSESNLNILSTAGQQIRLQVADTELQTL